MSTQFSHRKPSILPRTGQRIFWPVTISITQIYCYNYIIEMMFPIQNHIVETQITKVLEGI